MPEAQLDRFLMQVLVDYPDQNAELEILKLARNEAEAGNIDPPSITITQNVLMAAREEILQLHMAEALEQYIVQITMATRQPERYSSELKSWIEYGASPRATIALDRCARAHAWLNGRDYVSPDDVQSIAVDVLRHRLVLSFEAEASGMSSEAVIQQLLRQIPVA